jgi:hypothetical protein
LYWSNIQKSGGVESVLSSLSVYFDKPTNYLFGECQKRTPRRVTPSEQQLDKAEIPT